MVGARILESLSAEDRRRVLQRCRRQRFARKAFVFHAGEAGDSLHIIDSGRVAVLAGGAMGEPITVRILGPGDAFGELALLTNARRRTATIQALATTETLVLHRDTFEELRRQHPSIDRALVTALATEVDHLTMQLVEAAELPANTRIYRKLTQLGVVFDVTDSSNPIPITQAELASMAGVKLRITNEVIRRAKLDGLLAIAKRRIEVLDWVELYRRARLAHE